MSLGVEYGAVYTLTGPDGTVAVFNDSSSPNFVGALSAESSGLDSPEVREDAQDATEADGGIHGNFWYGRRPVILQGTILATTTADRNAKVSKLLRASNAMRGDAVLKWKPVGAPAEVSINLRRQQPVRLTKGFVKDFFLPMVSPSAQIMSTTLKTAAATGAGPSGPTALISPNEGVTNSTALKATGVGGTWNNPSRIKAIDALKATVTGDSGHSELIVGYDYAAISIPTTATIVGIEAAIKRSRPSGSTKDYGVWVWDEAKKEKLGSNKASGEEWPGIEATKTYGGPTDLWGLTTSTLNPTFLNSTSYGICLAVQNGGTSAYGGSVDHIGTTVYYKNPPIKVTVNNEGDAPADSFIEINGPATNIVLENVTTGKSIKIDHEIPEGASLNINFADRTIIASIGTNLYHKLDFVNSEWWDLAPGSNVIEATVEAAETSSTKLEAQFRDTWI